ncbi:MAG TPA: dihydroorotate dehydrogenase [bacterium]|nr:dihydroorotate dehydrogenase [bacterium]HPN43601.1 dihydroorotate dehydrogenase [bacterium]
MSDLTLKIGRLVLANPVTVASGTFGYAEEFADFIDLNQLGGIITKTVTLEPRPGNPPPRIAETSGGMLNSIGLPNVGVQKFITDKMPFLRTLTTKIIVNVAGKSAEDYPEIIRILDAVEGIDAYELNYSCPNVKEGGLSFSANAHVAESVTKSVRAVTNRPIIAKLTPNVTAIGEIGLAVEQGGADAVSAVNTFVGMAIDIPSRRPKIAMVTAGYSGPAIKPLALAKVYELYKKIHIPIIGIGGICDTNDAIEFLIAGAAAIQVGTANFWDPCISIKIVEGLQTWCRQNHIQKITELTGSLKIK